jgi:hypothetical protein
MKSANGGQSFEDMTPEERMAAVHRIDQARALQELRKATKPKRRSASEMQEAFYLAAWLDLMNLLFIHVPNEGQRSRLGGYLLRRAGMRPGAADYVIFNTPPKRPDLKGVIVELKKEKSDGPTPDQEQFLLDAAAQGYGAFWIETGEAAVEKLKADYGYGKR